MTTATRNAKPRGLGLLLLAALVALATLIGGAGTASAAIGSHPGNGVGASNPAVVNIVGAGQGITAGQGRGHAVLAPDSVVATGGAAKAAPDLTAGYSSFGAAKRAMGSPGQGNVYDHVVEQSQIKRSGFAADEIHNPFNMNPVSARTNQIKANFYSTKQPFTGGGTVRDWLTGQSFGDQYQFGMQTLADINAGVIK